MSASATAAVPGFYGKLPSEGDFVGRRLPWAFTQAWDAWLQEGMQASRAALGERWLATWLGAPLWRFRLAPGLCGPAGWRGLFFPSVDRVGRYFPLTVAVADAGPSSPVDEDAWRRLEDAALAALDPATTLDALDALLQPLAVPGFPADASRGGLDLLAPGTGDAPDVALRYAGLPPAAAFARLLGAGEGGAA